MIKEEKWNAQNFCTLVQIKSEVVAISEAQQWYTERTVTSATTSAAEKSESEADFYQGESLKDTYMVPPA